MSEFVVGAIIAFIIILLASCEEAKAAVTVNTNLVPPMPPIVTITKKTVNLSAGTSGAAKSTSSTTSATKQDVAQPLVIVPPPKTNYVFPPIGTLQKVTDYAVKATTVVLIYSWAYETNGQEIYYGGTTRYILTNVITSKTQLDQQFIVPALSNIVLYNFCTNANPVWDKSKGVVVDVVCDINTLSLGLSQDLLWYYNTIQLINNPDGSWSVPNLSSVSTQLEDSIPFYVPNAQWARMEVGHNGDPDPFEVDDNLYDPGSSPLYSDGYVYLDTDYITDSSTASGNFWIKTSLFDGTNVFQIFDGDGNSVPETPMNLRMSKDSSYAYVTVNGGDSGRGYMLEWSSDLKSWTNGPVNFFSPLPEDEALPPQFYWQLSTNTMFFRTATTNAVPY